MLIHVKNARNTSKDVPYGYDDWSDFWSKKTGKPFPILCSVYNCCERAEVGAHVVIVNDYSGNTNIVPLCYSHNNDFGADNYVDSSMLVRIN